MLTMESEANVTVTSAFNESALNGTLPPDMVFGDAQIISIAAYTPLFIISASLNLRVLGNLLRTKERSGLTRLNQLLLHLVLADLSVRVWRQNFVLDCFLQTYRGFNKLQFFAKVKDSGGTVLVKGIQYFLSKVACFKLNYRCSR